MLKGTLASASVVVSSDVAYILELRHSLNLKQDIFFMTSSSNVGKVKAARRIQAVCVLEVTLWLALMIIQM